MVFSKRSFSSQSTKQESCHLWNVGNAGEVVSEYAYPWDIFSDDFETTIRVFAKKKPQILRSGMETKIILFGMKRFCQEMKKTIHGKPFRSREKNP